MGTHDHVLLTTGKGAPMSTMIEQQFLWLYLWKNWGTKGINNLSGTLGQVSGWAKNQIKVCMVAKIMLFPPNTYCLQPVHSNVVSLSGKRLGKGNGEKEGDSGSSVFRD